MVLRRRVPVGRPRGDREWFHLMGGRGVFYHFANVGKMVQTNYVSMSPRGLSQRTLRIQNREPYIYAMAIKTEHQTNDDDTWFITFTCYSWISLFEITHSYDLVYKWLKLIDDKHSIKTLGFVIMPNHAHILLQLPANSSINLNKLVGNGKRFMTYALVDRLEEIGRHDLLTVLGEACSARERAKGQKHRGFEKSFDAKPVYSLDFLHQKLDYIHHNPVSGKWRLCEEFVDYPHSSAAFYELERAHPLLEITDYRLCW
jgi:REP element-mobilizing transposase RayT